MSGRLGPRITMASLHPVVMRLSALATLSDPDRRLIEQLSHHRAQHQVGDELIVEGQKLRRARFIVSGWATSQRLLADGRRQIFGVALPGDGVGLCPWHSPPALCSVTAATTMETVEAEPVLARVRAGGSPGLTRALAAAGRLDELFVLDHITRLGSQTAYERVAHFLLEVQHRLAMAGLGDDHRFPLPLTQEIMADALGLSVVHINRTLQQMRRDQLIELRSGTAILLQREALIRVADFRWPAEWAASPPAPTAPPRDDQAAAPRQLLVGRSA